MTGRATKEWIGRTPDSKAPPRIRLRIFDRYNGTCQLSNQKIKTGDKWELHHKKGLHEGGENRESNLVPVLVEPHKAETKRQRKVKKKVDSTRAKHVGAAASEPTLESRNDLAGRSKKGPPKIDKSALPPLGPGNLARQYKPKETT